MTINDVRRRLSGRRRAPAGYPEVTETCHTRLSLDDHMALQAIRLQAAVSGITYSELIRALIQAAAADLLGVDDGTRLRSVDQIPGGVLLHASPRDPVDRQRTGYPASASTPR